MEEYYSTTIQLKGMQIVLLGTHRLSSQQDVRCVDLVGKEKGTKAAVTS